MLLSSRWVASREPHMCDVSEDGHGPARCGERTHKDWKVDSMDVVKEEHKQVVDMNETEESQGVSDDLWKPSIGEKLWICKEDGTVWTVGILEEENKVIAKPPFGKEEEILRGEDGVWKVSLSPTNGAI